MLLRFFKSNVLSDSRRIIISGVTGILLSIATLVSSEMVYGNHSIVDSSVSIPIQILSCFGMSFFFIPLTSEVIGSFDYLSNKELNHAQSPKVLFYEKNNTVYFFVMWAIFFLSFIPMFLYAWPGNFVADAGYQIILYMGDNMSTHHPILHTILMGVFYKRGLDTGNISFWFQFYTLIQIFVLSASFAFFMSYIKRKNVSRVLRIVIFAFFACNPLIDYFAVSTVKGVLASALLIFAITSFLYLIEGKSMIINSIVFALTSILSCHFRNNMIYAIMVTLIVVLIFKRGLMNKALALVLLVVVFFGYKLSLSLLMKATDAADTDSARESLSVPLMCLAHVAIDKKEELDPAFYDEICMYINEDTFEDYTYCISDPIKNDANEKLLQSNKLNFFKLFLKVGLKYPGKYFEAFCGLSCGYYAPLNSPFFLSGSTKFYTMGAGDYPPPSMSNKLPFGSFYYDFMFGEVDGRLKLPLIGYLWRNSTYLWGYVFAFMYLIYKKKYNNLFVLLFPFLYMMTCLLGPATFIRYLYVNISTVAVALFLVIHKDITSSKEAHG